MPVGVELVAVTRGFGMSVPEVLVRHTALGEHDFVLVPDAVAAVGQGRAVGTARADPLHLVVPDFSAAARDLAIPFIAGPGAGAVGRVAVRVARVPRGIPLHQQVVVGVGRVAPDLAVEHLVGAVGETVEDAGATVVAEDVEAGRDDVPVRERARAATLRVGG